MRITLGLGYLVQVAKWLAIQRSAFYQGTVKGTVKGSVVLQRHCTAVHVDVKCVVCDISTVSQLSSHLYIHWTDPHQWKRCTRETDGEN